jgi:hypothetical protein
MCCGVGITSHANFVKIACTCYTSHTQGDCSRDHSQAVCQQCNTSHSTCKDRHSNASLIHYESFANRQTRRSMRGHNGRNHFRIVILMDKNVKAYD